MPLKPVKRGIKVWECADTSNGYVCNQRVYTGKERHANPKQGLGYRVVHALTWPVVGTNRHAFIDNFFSYAERPNLCFWNCPFKSARHSTGDCANYATSETSLTRRIAIPGNREGDPDRVERRVPSVPVVKSYNNNMDGVDLNYQLRGYYMTGRKSKKWWRCRGCFYRQCPHFGEIISES